MDVIKKWARSIKNKTELAYEATPDSASYHSPSEPHRLVTVACFQLLDYILCYCMFLYICLHYRMSGTHFSVVFTYQTQSPFQNHIQCPASSRTLFDAHDRLQ